MFDAELFQVCSMDTAIHTLSASSDEESNDSLPDLATRVKGKLSGNAVPEIQNPDKADDDDDLVILEEVVTPKPLNRKTIPSVPIVNDDKSRLLSLMAPVPTAVADDFEEELPEIQDFTLLTSEAMECSEESQDHNLNSQIAVKNNKKLRSEELRAEKEAKRKQREAQKLERAREKAEAKAQREAERTSKRATKPGECMKYVIVQLDRRLLESVEGSQVLSELQSADLRYRIVESPVPAAVTVLRVEPLTLQETLTEEAVVIVAVDRFCELVRDQVYEGGLTGLSQECCRWRNEISTPNLTIIVCGVEAVLRGQKTLKQQNFRSSVLGEVAGKGRGGKKPTGKRYPECPSVSRIDIETALVTMQLEHGISHRLCSDPHKVANFVVQFTKAVAETPFKRERAEPSFSWYAEGSSINTVKIDKSGVGLLKLWHQQLRQFLNVGVEVAQAIVKEYPSPSALLQAYSLCDSSNEASLLLANIPVRRGAGPLVSTRRIGPELSKKVYTFFTSTNPEMYLG